MKRSNKIPVLICVNLCISQAVFLTPVPNVPRSCSLQFLAWTLQLLSFLYPSAVLQLLFLLPMPLEIYFKEIEPEKDLKPVCWEV